MPQIPVFQGTPGRFVMPETGAEATARAARLERVDIDKAGAYVGGAIAHVGGQIGQRIDQHNTQAEISEGGVHMMQFLDQSNQEWNTLAKNSDPNDASIRQKFLEQKQKDLAAWSDKFSTPGGQRWASMQSEHLLQHLGEKTAADQATRAGDAVITNLTQFSNHAASAAMNDPSSADAIMGVADNYIESQIQSNPNLDAGAAAKIRGQLTQKLKGNVAQAALLSVAQKNPDAAEKMLNSGKWADYIDPAQMRSTINTIRRTKETDARLARMEDAQAKRQASEDAANQTLASMVDPATNKLVVPAGAATSILLNPHLQPSEKMTLLNFTQAQARRAEEGKRATTDPATYGDLSQRVFSGQASEMDLAKAHAQGTLSDHDYSVLMEGVRAAKTSPAMRQNNQDFSNFVKGLTPLIDKSTLFQTSPDGKARAYQFEVDMKQRFDDGLQSGLSAKDMLNPQSPNFIAKDIARYQAQGGLTGEAGRRFLQSQTPEGVTGMPTVPKAAGTEGAPPAPAPAAPKLYKPGMSMDDLAKALNGKK